MLSDIETDDDDTYYVETERIEESVSKERLLDRKRKEMFEGSTVSKFGPDVLSMGTQEVN